MSVRFDASSDRLSRTTTLPTITAFTVMGWVSRTTTGNGTYEGALAFGSATASYIIYVVHSGTVGFAVTNWIADFAGSAMTNGTWYHLAMTCSGTGAGQLLGYFNGALNATGNGNSAAAAGTLMCSASPAEGAEWMNGRLAAVKVYSAVLTAEEIKMEMTCTMPIRTANLNTWAPLLASTDVGNYAGTGVWTVGGTLTTEQGPPIAWAPQQRFRGVPPAAAVVATKAPPPRLRPWRFMRRGA